MVTVADFTNLANKELHSGLLNIGSKNFKLAKKYAKEVAIDFADWLDDNVYAGYIGENGKPMHNIRGDKKDYTTEQMFEIFLTRQQ